MPSVKVHFLSSRRKPLLLEVDETTTVQQLKEQITRVTRVHPRDFRLISQSNELVDNLFILSKKSLWDHRELCTVYFVTKTNARFSPLVKLCVRGVPRKNACSPSSSTAVFTTASSSSATSSSTSSTTTTTPHTTITTPHTTTTTPHTTTTTPVFIQVRVDDSVGAVKKKIAVVSQSALPSDEQELIYRGMKLDDGSLIGDQLDLAKKPVLRVVHKPNDSKEFNVVVDIGGQRKLTVPICRKETVAILKARLYKMYPIPRDCNFSLSFDGHQLQDTDHIAKYSITGGSVLRIARPEDAHAATAPKRITVQLDPRTGVITIPMKAPVQNGSPAPRRFVNVPVNTPDPAPSDPPRTHAQPMGRLTRLRSPSMAKDDDVTPKRHCNPPSPQEPKRKTFAGLKGGFLNPKSVKPKREALFVGLSSGFLTKKQAKARSTKPVATPATAEENPPNKGQPSTEKSFQPSHSRRCAKEGCRRKLPLGLDLPCKCGAVYCPLHTMSHACTFDYKKEHRHHLNQELEFELQPKQLVQKI